MSDGLPVLRVAEVIRKLRKAGFVFDRHAKSSHEIWIHPETRRRVVIPNHPGDVRAGTLRNIIRQMGLTLEEFNAL